MKILTWNVQRLEKNENKKILAKLCEFGADIIVLTETSSILNLGENYNCISTETLTENYDNVNYKVGENRTSIWTKYNFVNHFQTFDNYTSICSKIQANYAPYIQHFEYNKGLLPLPIYRLRRHHRLQSQSDHQLSIHTAFFHFSQTTSV